MLDRSFASTQTLQIADLHTLDIFYTPLEARFDRITRLARKAMQVRVAAITLVDKQRQWFKSIDGWDMRELARSHSLCLQTISKGETVIIEDLRKDPGYFSHPLVTAEPNFIFYAGFPLVNAYGIVVGTFCVYDTRPRSLTPGDIQSLRDAGESAQKELLINELHEAQNKLVAKLGAARRQATLDELTRVWNRRGGLELLNEMLKLANRESRILSVCMLDLDRFKEVNDEFGHHTGDQVLRKVAALIIGCLRSDDIVCRYGGDEFLLVLAETGRDGLQSITERIRKRVSEFPIETREGPVRMTLSIGAAFHRFGRGEVTQEMFVGFADKALFSAKRAGRNSVQLVDCVAAEAIDQPRHDDKQSIGRLPIS
ncbi:MAG: sensor domain-containing diguanylate cyclase [Gammaproteobacteria bacterium]|nr:sensor domain-containing diguanylate cyclase [Gammaproteobacteria bacterium]